MAEFLLLITVACGANPIGVTPPGPSIPEIGNRVMEYKACRKGVAHCVANKGIQRCGRQYHFKWMDEVK